MIHLNEKFIVIIFQRVMVPNSFIFSVAEIKINRCLTLSRRYRRLMDSKIELPDEKSSWAITLVPFEAPVINSFQSKIPNTLLFISSDGQFFSTIPQVTCIINLCHTVCLVHCESVDQSDGQNQKYHFEFFSPIFSDMKFGLNISFL